MGTFELWKASCDTIDPIFSQHFANRNISFHGYDTLEIFSSVLKRWLYNSEILATQHSDFLSA